VTEIDLSGRRRIHVIGVGGAGMSAIADVLAAMGHDVSGSDLRTSAPLERLAVAGVTVHVGHDAAHVGDEVDLVAVSTAIPESNVERVAARQRGIPVATRAEVLAAIAALRSTVAVAGTHGKTTTSSMLALVLIGAGARPSFIIGGDVNEIGTGSAWDDGDLFVVEADESDGTFLQLPRHAAVITNVEPDHLEHYGSWPALQDAFVRFATETPGPVVMCADDEGAALLAERVGATTYGVAADADYRMANLETGRFGSAFSLVHDGTDLGAITLPVAGAHNARNAAAAAVTGLALGVPFADAAAALARFGGVARRFEHRGEAGGVTFIDDYAHLPTEVAAAVDAARDGGWERLVCVFQPHRFSRTAALWQDFAGSFDAVDLLVVTDIYSSGEAARPGVTGELIVRAARQAAPDLRVQYVPRRADLVTFLVDELRAGDLCLTLGAGDLTTLPPVVQAGLLEATT